VSNTAAVDSGGLFCSGAGVLQMVDGCQFRRNVCSGWFGAARIDTSAGAELRGVEIVENQSLSAAGGIGGLQGRMTLQDVRVISNHTAGEGGGLYVGRNCRIAAWDDLELHGNRAACGGAAYIATGGVLSVWGGSVRPRVTANEAAESGGGFYLAGSNALVELLNVDVGLPGEGNRSHYLYSTVVSSTMPVWVPDLAGAPQHIGGGGVAVLNAATLRAYNCRFIDNISSNHGGALLVCSNAHAEIHGDPLAAPPWHVPHSQMLNNRVVYTGSGGAVFAVEAGRVNIRNSLLARNGALINGGALYVLHSPYELVNVLVVDNTRGGHLSAFTSAFNTRAWMRHCTIANNSGIGVLSAYDSSLAMTNTIVWGQPPTNLWFIDGTQHVHYCDIQGGHPGAGNIDADPAFAMPALLDYRLSAGTPCTAGCPAGVGIDCIGFARPLDGTYEMGAYEFAPSNVVAVWPIEIDFGPVHLGDTATELLNVENYADIAVEWGVHDTWTPFGSDPTTGVLPAHGYQPIDMSFAPLQLGPTSRIVYLLSTGGGQDVRLRGEGVPEPAVLCALATYAGLGVAILWLTRKQ
jgi:hypothetical protein